MLILASISLLLLTAALTYVWRTYDLVTTDFVGGILLIIVTWLLVLSAAALRQAIREAPWK